MENLDNVGPVHSVRMAVFGMNRSHQYREKQMEKFTVKLGISSLNSEAVEQKGRNVHDSILGNAFYPTLSITSNLEQNEPATSVTK